MKRNYLVLLTLGFATYFVAFYQTRLPTLEGKLGDTWTRFDFLQLVFAFPAALVEGWFGPRGQFAIADRLPLLATAGSVLGWAAALGWLALVALGIDRALAKLECFVFAMGLGLATISNYVLLVGLTGALDRAAWFALPMAGTYAVAGWLIWQRSRKARSLGPNKGKQADSSESNCPASDRATPSSAGSSRRPRSTKRDSPGQSGASRVRASGRQRGKPSSNASTATSEVSHPGRTATDPPDCGVALGAGWLWLAFPFALVLILGGMLPPIEFDVLEYHLQAPKEFYQQGRITLLPHNVYANMPLGAEMLSLLSMVLLGDWWIGGLAGKTATSAMTLVTTAGVYAAGYRLFGQTAAVVAALVFVSVPWIVQVSTLGMIEPAVAMYWFLAVYAVILWRLGDGSPQKKTVAATGTGGSAGEAAADAEAADRLDLGGAARLRGDWRMVLLAGYLAGAALACKYPAALFVVLPLAIAAACGLLKARGPSGFAVWALFLLAVTISAGPWLAKNAVLAENPTYPLLYEVFGGRSWSPEANAQWNRVHRPHDFSLARAGYDLKQVLLGSEWLSPLMVPLAALGMFSRRHRRLLLVVALYLCFVFAAWWLLTHRIDRFWIPAMPLMALIAGAGACVPRGRAWKWALTALLVLGTLSNFVFDTSGLGGYNRYFASLEQLRHDPQRVDPWHLWLNRFPPDGTVALVGEAGVYNLEPTILYSTCFDENPVAGLARGCTAGEFHRRLIDRDVALVYVNWPEIARYRRSYGFDPFFQPRWFEIMTEAGIWEPLPPMPGHGGRMYRVRPRPGVGTAPRHEAR
jgi:hypothetical protein